MQKNYEINGLIPMGLLSQVPLEKFFQQVILNLGILYQY